MTTTPLNPCPTLFILSIRQKVTTLAHDTLGGGKVTLLCPYLLPLGQDNSLHVSH